MTVPCPTHPVRLLGLPTDEASSFVRGAAAGPEAIRRALYSSASNLVTEAGLDLGEEARFEDAGDLRLSGGETTRDEIERAVAELLAGDARPLCLGGDHSVSFPVLRAVARAHAARGEALSVVQVDAHPDLYDRFQGERYSHACPFARVMEEGLAERLVQIGVRGANRHQLEQAERFGVEIVPRASWTDLAALQLRPPLYLSLDLDGLDPAFAPGVAHLQPGGLTSRELLDIVWGLPGLVGADVVELVPNRDVGDLTATVAAKLVKEIAGRLLEGRVAR